MRADSFIDVSKRDLLKNAYNAFSLRVRLRFHLALFIAYIFVRILFKNFSNVLEF